MNQERGSDAEGQPPEGAATAEPRHERLAAWGRGLLEAADYYLCPFGSMFGMVFTTLALSPLAEGEPAIVDLLALGIALFALSRAAAAGMFGRRHRCRCGQAGAAPQPPVTTRPEP